MSKMQSTNFRSVEDMLDYLPKEELEMVTVIRRLILSTIPDCEERLAYQVPYYYRASRICFIWPGSVPWGNVTFQGVIMGFCRGYLLNDQAGYLDKGNRKQVCTKTFRQMNEIDVDLLRSYLFDAVEVDKRSLIIH